MPDRNLPVTEDELHAYVDGELPQDRRAAVETWLASHPDDAARVNAWRAQIETIRGRFAGIANEPVPERLTLESVARLRRPSLAVLAASILLALAVGGAAGWWLRGTSSAMTMAEFDPSVEARNAHNLYSVEVSRPVEVPGSERQRLTSWLSKRVGYSVRVPDLEPVGLKLVGGRLLPGTKDPAAFLMYEGSSGDRFTLYSSRTGRTETAMRYAAEGKCASFYWVDGDVTYVVSGEANRTRLQQVAQAVYDTMENRPRSDLQAISRRGS